MRLGINVCRKEIREMQTEEQVNQARRSGLRSLLNEPNASLARRVSPPLTFNAFLGGVLSVYDLSTSPICLYKYKVQRQEKTSGGHRLQSNKYAGNKDLKGPTVQL